jgi:hypothetical protein
MEASKNKTTTADSNKHIFNIGTYKIVWGAVIAGALVSLICATLLNFLGLGLGLSIVDMEDTSVLKLGIGVIVWLTISGILSALVCGWFAGIFSNTLCKFERGCHGVVSWSLAMLITILLTTAGTGTVLGGVADIAKHNSDVKSKIAMAVIKKGLSNLTSSETTKANEKDSISKNMGDTADKIGVSSLIIFVISLLSVIASILGAVYCGSNSYRHLKT